MLLSHFLCKSPLFWGHDKQKKEGRVEREKNLAANKEPDSIVVYHSLYGIYSTHSFELIVNDHIGSSGLQFQVLSGLSCSRLEGR
jgi:hypothetical protein